MSGPLRLVVRLTPRGGRDAVDGWAIGEDGKAHLKARVAAPPVDGAANQALVRLIARTLLRPPGAVRIVAGDRGRVKQVEIDGIGEPELRLALGAPA